MRINALEQLLSNLKHEHYHSMIFGSITGFVGFLGLEGIFIDRIITMIFALFTALLGGFLAPMGKELYDMSKIHVKKKLNKWKK